MQTSSSTGRSFKTIAGNVDTGPREMQVGDSVCILAGGNIPFILRPQGKSYRLIGPAYVNGIMDGEAVSKWREQCRSKREIFEIE
jgi:hypothetical protein